MRDNFNKAMYRLITENPETFPVFEKKLVDTLERLMMELTYPYARVPDKGFVIQDQYMMAYGRGKISAILTLLAALRPSYRIQRRFFKQGLYNQLNEIYTKIKKALELGKEGGEHAKG